MQIPIYGAWRGKNTHRAHIISVLPLKQIRATEKVFHAQCFRFEKAAAGKHAYAMFALGRISVTADKDYKKAVGFFQQAVDNGNKDALYELANCYFHGFGVKPDKTKGLELLRKAAEQGVPDAQHILGTLYEKGDGVPKDAKKAVEWFSRAVAVVKA